MIYDFIIVGSGLTGSTIARQLHDRGFKILVIEQKSHIGGNVFDFTDNSGIKIHKYGPHYFRTSDERIWNFINRFGSFYKYVPCLKTIIDGKLENWPIASSYINKTIGSNWQPFDIAKDPKNFEQAALSLMPELIYEKFIKGYNIKQWGVDPRELEARLIKRFDVREDDDPRLMPRHKYQGIPEKGYTSLVNKMLVGIPVLLNVDYLKLRNEFKYSKKLIFTGPIDTFFDYKFGKLKYRGQKRETKYLPDMDWFQECGQVNNPQIQNGPHIRTIEWKHIMPIDFSSKIKGTVITTETPFTPSRSEDYEYPFPDLQNSILFKKYKAEANKLKDTIICGRLGEYKYYDMDQAIGRAFKLVNQIQDELNQG